MLSFFSLAMTRAVGRRRLLSVDRDQARIRLCGFCGGRSGAGTGFSSPLFQYHSTSDCYLSSCLHLDEVGGGKWARLGGVSTKMMLFWTSVGIQKEMYLHYVFRLKRIKIIQRN